MLFARYGVCLSLRTWGMEKDDHEIYFKVEMNDIKITAASN